MSEIQVCPLSNLSIEKLLEDLHEALPGWSDAELSVNAVGYLRWFHYLTREKGFTVREANRAIFEEGCDRLRDWSEKDAEKAQWLKEKYGDNVSQTRLMERYGIAMSVVNQRSGSARKRLAEAVFQMEHRQRNKHREQQIKRLKTPTYTKLFGVEAIQKTLQKYSKPGSDPYLIQLTGKGGDGKSTQADYLSRYLIAEDIWDEIYWISIKPESWTSQTPSATHRQPTLTCEILVERLFNQCFPNLQNHESYPTDTKLMMLVDRQQQYPFCLFIDDIESAQSIQDLLPTLESLANPSKIILMTREEIAARNIVVTRVDLPELTKEEALSLIKETAQTKNLARINFLSNEELALVYNMVGGHPHTLCLLTSQINMVGLHQTLENFKKINNQTNRNFLENIYSHSWMHLTKSARTVLFVMPLLSPQGGTYALLLNIIQMNEGELFEALKELVAFSLIQQHIHNTDILYSIHPLTRLFLYQMRQQAETASTNDEILLSDFDTFITRAIDYAHETIKQGDEILSEYQRQQALHILDIGLDNASRNHSLWSYTCALLAELMPKLEGTGFNEEWAEYVKRGIEVSEANSDQHNVAFLQAHLGSLYKSAGHYASAHQVLERSAAYFKQHGDANRLASILAQQAYMHALQRRHTEARPLLKNVFELLDVTDPHREYVYYIEGLLALNDNDGVAAEQWFKKSLQCCEQLHDDRLSAKRLSSLGTALYMQEQYQQALAHYGRATILFETLHDDVQIAIAYIGMGIVALARKQPQDALLVLEKAEPSLRRVHDVLHLAVLEVNLGIAAHQLKQWSKAEEHLLRAISRYQQLKDFYREANARYEYALVLQDQNLKAEARLAYTMALTCLSQCDPSPGREALYQKINRKTLDIYNES